jgi:nucleotide-binding universal stress UspA family protein
MGGVVVGVDLSDAAARALGWALAEAELRNTRLTVVRVIDPVRNNVFVTYPNNRGSTGAELVATRADLDDRLAKVVADRGVPARVDVETRVVVGDVAFELLRAAADADLLVVGARGISSLRRAFVGSVSSTVVHHSRGPVTVVP